MSHAGPRTARYLPAWIWVTGSVLVAIVVIWVGGTVVAAILPRGGTPSAAETAAAVPSITPTTTPSPSAPPVVSAPAAPVSSGSTVASGASLLTPDDVAAIQGAISSQNPSAIAPYLPGSVSVVIGAGSGGGSLGPASAIAQLQSLMTSTATWNFAIDPGTLTHYRQGSYGAYFPSNAIVGKSSDGHVFSFLPRGHSIATIFMIGDETLLVTD